MSDWAGFWIFLAVVWACDAWLYSKGHDTMFFKHKTDAEMRIQEAQVKRLEAARDE